MVYPTSLPADAASVAVFEEGMSPEYEQTITNVLVELSHRKVFSKEEVQEAKELVNEIDKPTRFAALCVCP